MSLDVHVKNGPFCHSKSNAVELNFNRTQSNSIRGLSGLSSAIERNRIQPQKNCTIKLNRVFDFRTLDFFKTGFMHQSIPAAPIPPPGNCGAFARTVSPGGRALAYPRATPGLLTHVVSDLKSTRRRFYRKRPVVCH